MKYLIIIYMMLLTFTNLESKPVWNLYLDSEFDPNTQGMVSYIWRINCADTNNIFALNLRENYYGRIFNSMDKGKTWNCIYNEFPGTYSGPEISCINISNPFKKFIYLTYEHSTLRITKDACQTWDTVTFLPKNLRLYNIYMQDTLNGVIAGQEHPTGQPYLILTHDGWKTHKAIPRDSLPLDAFITYPYIEGKDTVMFFSSIGGKSLRVYLSVDQCKTWKIDTLSEIGSISYYGKPFIKSKTGEYWLTGSLENGIGDQSYDVIYKLDKIGSTWTKVYSGDLSPTFGLQEIAFGDALNGVAVGAAGKILRTTDGGKTWFQEFIYTDGEIDDSSPVLHVEYCGYTPLIGDYNGRIFRLEDDGTGDVEEEINYSNAYGIRTEVNEQEIKVNIKTEKAGEAKVAIFDMQGREIMAKNASINVGISQLSISTSGLSSGIYLYAIEIDGIRIKTEKISIVK